MSKPDKPERLTIKVMEQLAVLEYAVAQLSKQVEAIVRPSPRVKRPAAKSG